jgi:hypothetical protein
LVSHERLVFSFHKPFSKVCPADIWTSLKEKITLMAIDLDCIPVALAASLQRCCWTNIQDLFDGILTAIFPARRLGKICPSSEKEAITET